WAAHQAEIAGADILKNARRGSRCRFASQNEITRPSRATITVPADGPYRSIAMKTKTSEIEIEAWEDGSLTVAEPLTSVSAANRNHCCGTGPRYSWYTQLETTITPVPMTAGTKIRPNRDR